MSTSRARSVCPRAACPGSPGLPTVVEPLAPFLGDEESDYEPVPVWGEADRRVEDYLQVFGRPEQLEAWREGRPYIAEPAEVNV
ncbi:hypothetical protein [Streptomyces sp. 8N706]|uniref:hypothetical protein n=1 Tax=Streptomyces sp. 8N706 TaxID=3457416 RepID=UPI003FCFBE47